MRPEPVAPGVSALVAFAALGWASPAVGAIPAGYTGTPYQGTAQSIPGRVELANLDEGGLNVAFFADHRRDNAVAEGYSPISGDDYRPGNLALPNICKTNRALEKPGDGSEDFWEDGKRYPSEDEPYAYYMGYAHTVDWVRVTVNVAQAGTYNVSSNWACANPECGLSLWFNDGASSSDNPDRPLDGENRSGVVKLQGTNDYHKWRAYPSFAQVELEAGVQLMTFNVEVADHLQYGFLQFDLVGGDAPGGAGGVAGAGGASAPATGGAGSGGVSSSGGATSSAGSSSSSVAGASAAGATAAAGSASAGAPGGIGAMPAASDDGSCSMSARARATWPSVLLAGALGLMLGARRRRRYLV
jgi:hypothetical protein